jgi:hypothetical protein
MAKKDIDEKPDEPLIPEDQSEEGMVKVHKTGKYLNVHPSCVAAHEKAGWTVVD